MGYMTFYGSLKMTLAICRASICALYHMDMSGLQEICEASLKDQYRGRPKFKYELIAVSLFSANSPWI
jgi:hypothetical protein